MDWFKLKMLKLSILSFVTISYYLDGSFVSALDNGLARTPPMGWISWVRFTCDINCAGSNKLNCISYELYERMARSMKDKGFVDLGYNYVNIDDCWSEFERDELTKRLVPHKERFRGNDGIKELASTLRELNVKLGIYGDCGTQTCAKYPAQLSKFDSLEGNFYKIDAETFYSWGIESFKFDGCYITPNKSEQICPGMSKALELNKKDNNKPILLTCEWPSYMATFRHPETIMPVDWDLVKRSCNLWRHFEDIYDSWLSVETIIDYCISMQDVILKYHGPGGWFDPDQIIVGGFGLSRDQARAHMVLWSIWSAPLFMSNDVEKLQPWEVELLQNRNLISVNQDQLGIWAQMVHEDGKAVWSMGKLQVFVKPTRPKQDTGSQLFCPDFVIAYLYRGSLGNSIKFSINIRQILLKSDKLIQEASNRQGHPEWAKKCLDRIIAIEPDSNKNIKGFHVKDLLDSLADSEQELSIDGYLTLVVNPTGIRVVKLTENV